MDIKISNTSTLLGLVKKSSENSNRVVVEGKTATIREEKPTEEKEDTNIKMVRRDKKQIEEERRNSVQKFFLEEIHRKLTESELEEYLRLFAVEKTNAWLFAEKIKIAEQEVINV